MGVNKKISEFVPKTFPNGKEVIGTFDPSADLGSEEGNKGIAFADFLKYRISEKTVDFEIANDTQNTLFVCKNTEGDMNVTVTAASLNIGESCFFIQYGTEYATVLSFDSVDNVEFNYGDSSTNGIGAVVSLTKVGENAFITRRSSIDVVNNLIDGGSGKSLSAEMGVVLNNMISPLTNSFNNKKVRSVSIVNFDSTYSANVLTASSDGFAFFDSVNSPLGSFNLFAGQTDAKQNGVYECTRFGDISTPAEYTRRSDMNTSDGLNEFLIVFCEMGDDYKDTYWGLSNNRGGIVLDTDDLDFVQIPKPFIGGGTIDADDIDDTSTTNKFVTQAEKDLIASAAQVDDLGDLAVKDKIGSGDVENNAIGLGNIATIAGNSILGNPTSSTEDVVTITATSDGQVLRRSGGALGLGTIDSTFITNFAKQVSQDAVYNGTVSRSGTNAYSLASSGKSYTVMPKVIQARFGSQNTGTGATTISLDSLTAVPIYDANTNLAIANGFINNDRAYLLVLDSSGGRYVLFGAVLSLDSVFTNAFSNVAVSASTRGSYYNLNGARSMTLNVSSLTSYGLKIGFKQVTAHTSTIVAGTNVTIIGATSLIGIGDYVEYMLLTTDGTNSTFVCVSGGKKIDSSFIASTGTNLTLNPINPYSNNFLWTVSASGNLLWSFTNVLDGNRGTLMIKHSGTVANYNIKPPTGAMVSDYDLKEYPTTGGSSYAIGAAVANSTNIRLTVATLPYSSGTYRVRVSGISGTIEANGDWTATIINSTTIDIPQKFYATYASAGSLVFLTKYFDIDQRINSETLIDFVHRNGVVYLTLTKGINAY